MAVTSTINRNSVFLKLNAGENENGIILTKSLSLGPVKNTAFSNEDLQKVYNIVNALLPCLAYNMYKLHLFVDNQIQEAE